MQLKESMNLPKNKVSNYIPDDICFDILSKLPLKSLKRFTCVCKFWANLFEKPEFMRMYRKHLSQSTYDDNHNSRLLFKQTPDGYGYEDNIFFLFYETFENNVKLDWPPPFECPRRGMFILGSGANVILCLFEGDGKGRTDSIVQKVVLGVHLPRNSRSFLVALLSIQFSKHFLLPLFLKSYLF
jgi:hypothetical protein